MFPTKIVKRDGRIVEFDMERITNAVFNAANSLYAHDQTMLNTVVKDTSELTFNILSSCNNNDKMTVEEIQDIVEHELMNVDKDVATAYIRYRTRRTVAREEKSDMINTMKELTFTDSGNSDIKRENANINTDSAMGVMLKYGSEVSKKFTNMELLDKDVMDAHCNGDIHMHDMDFYPTGTQTCCQIDIQELFKNGFSTGHGFLREPKSIRSYAALACIAIQSDQNDCHR